MYPLLLLSGDMSGRCYWFSQGNAGAPTEPIQPVDDFASSRTGAVGKDERSNIEHRTSNIVVPNINFRRFPGACKPRFIEQIQLGGGDCFQFLYSAIRNPKFQLVRVRVFRSFDFSCQAITCPDNSDYLVGSIYLEVGNAEFPVRIVPPDFSS